MKILLDECVPQRLRNLWLPKTPFSGFQPDVTLHSHREVSTTRLRIAESAQVRKP